MKGIFISYRRGGAGSHAAGRINKYLGDRFGSELLFMDVQDISPGQDFGKAIDAALSQCHAFIAVLDSYWNSAKQIQRLHDQDDYVRREITAALERDALILPALIDGVAMPTESSLPDCLKSFCRYQALLLRHETFEKDMGALIQAVDQGYMELAALQNSMQCPHCRKAVNISPCQTLVKCSSCGTKFGVLRVVLGQSHTLQTESSRELSRQLKLAKIDIDNENYHSAYEQYTQILDSSPDSWEAILNKAICLFWLGSEDLGHLDDVFALLDKADLLSNRHPRVDATRQSLAYNLAVIAEAEEMVGPGIAWSLELFKFSKSILPVHEDRDRLITLYVRDCFEEIQKRLIELLQKHGKDFDPPFAELSTLRKLMDFDQSFEIMRFFILMGNWKIQVSHNQNDLMEQLEKTRKEYARLYPDKPMLRIVFPFMGTPRIKES